MYRPLFFFLSIIFTVLDELLITLMLLLIFFVISRLGNFFPLEDYFNAWQPLRLSLSLSLSLSLFLSLFLVKLAKTFEISRTIERV